MDVAISGKIASGKSTVAAILTELIPRIDASIRPVKRKFAARLYRLCAALDGSTTWTENGWIPMAMSPSAQYIVLEEFLREVKALMPELEVTKTHHDSLMAIVRQTPTVAYEKNRERLREIAEYVRAAISPMVWITFLAQEHYRTALHTSPETSIISDLRLIPEAEWCRLQGILRLRINIDPEVQKERIHLRGEHWTRDRVEHYTECALDSYELWSAVILNDGTYDQLYNQVYAFTKRFLVSQTYSKEDIAG